MIKHQELSNREQSSKNNHRVSHYRDKLTSREIGNLHTTRNKNYNEPL